MTYTPKVYAGEHFSEIFSEILFANNTIAKSYVRLLDNVKAQTTITSLGGSVTIQDYKVNATAADSQGAINFADATVTPIKKMVLKTFNFEDVRFSRFSKDMPAGAAKLESNEYLSAVLGLMEPKISLAMENDFWAKIKTILQGDADVTEVAAATLSVANLKDELNKVYDAIDGELLESGDVVIYADRSVKKLVRQANLAATYRDFIVTGEDADYFLDVKIVYVPLGVNTMAAGRPSDFIWATDLISDMGSIQVDKVNNTGDEMFIKSVFTMDAAVCVPSQKVIYAAPVV
ncbi:hypothetical protein [Rufibacter ruber]|uniref:hypothetical protein n=1 Tax=Rufibacter ruber TaxID=1783499 RepID=UPI000832A178|nr:hypothetical protein [Rufibacter ruber]